MNVRRTRQALNLATAGLLAIAGALWLGALWPAGRAAGSALRRPEVLAKPAGSGLPAWSAFEPLLAVDLRKGLDDSGPNLASVPALAVKLTGTILEPGHNLAMFQSKDGPMELHGVGEKAGGAEILEITDNKVLVLYYGQRVTLSVEAENRAP